MLVLSRKKSEFIDIGGGISICVVAIKGDTVRIGIKAPDGVGIFRRELVEQIERERVEREQAEKPGSSAA